MGMHYYIALFLSLAVVRKENTERSMQLQSWPWRPRGAGVQNRTPRWKNLSRTCSAVSKSQWLLHARPCFFFFFACISAWIVCSAHTKNFAHVSGPESTIVIHSKKKMQSWRGRESRPQRILSPFSSPRWCVHRRHGERGARSYCNVPWCGRIGGS